MNVVLEYEWYRETWAVWTAAISRPNWDPFNDDQPVGLTIMALGESYALANLHVVKAHNPAVLKVRRSLKWDQMIRDQRGDWPTPTDTCAPTGVCNGSCASYAQQEQEE